MQKNIKLSITLVALISSLNANEAITLDPIEVVSATNSTQSITDVTSNIDVITSAEIEEKNYTTVTEALNSLPGISFSSNGGLGKSTSVYVRGFDSKRVLVLIDGIRYNDNTSLGGAPFEHLMIDDVEQIEVVKGAQSGIWGADATAGVINIITKSAKKGFSASINAEYGSFNTKKYGASLSYKTDKYYIKASSHVVDSDGFTAQAPRGTDIDNYEDDGYENTTSNIKLGFNINDTNKIDISHTIIDATTEADPFGNPDGQYNSTTKDTFSQINFNHVDSFNEIDLYAKKSVFSRYYPDDSWSQNFDGEVMEYGIKSNIPYRKDDFVVVGADYKSFEQDDSIKDKYINRALFLTNSNKFNGLIAGETIFTQSLRVDTYDKFENKTTGKLGIKHFHDIVEGLVTSANVGTAYNVPTLYNLYSPYGNANITPESTTSYDISVAYKALKLTYFYNTVEDMIDFDFTTFTYNNLSGKSKIKGFEVEYKTDIGEFLSLNTNYTRLDAKNSAGEVLGRRAKDTVKLSLDYYPLEELQLGVNGEYIGERYNYDNEQGEQTGKYTVINFVTNYDISQNLKAYLKVNNITDKYYQVVDGYATAPRSAYFGIKANF